MCSDLISLAPAFQCFEQLQRHWRFLNLLAIAGVLAAQLAHHETHMFAVICLLTEVQRRRDEFYLLLQLVIRGFFNRLMVTERLHGARLSLGEPALRQVVVFNVIQLF